MKINFLLLFGIFCPSILLMAQCANIEPATSMGSLQYKDRGKHCEGFYRSLVSANDLVLVSFTKGPLRYSSDNAEKLHLSLPTSINEQVRIRGYGIPRDLYYRMDLVLKPDDEFDWNTGTVLLKNNRTKFARFIGLLAFKGQKKKRTFMPVIVNTPKVDQPYLIQFVSSTRITQVKWRIVGHTEFVKINEGQSFRRDKPIKINLPNDLGSGKYKLEIQGREATNGITPITRTITFKI